MIATKDFKFDVKANTDLAGQFTGRASVYGVVDGYGDVVMPGSFTKSLADLGGRIKVLNQHNPSDPIGIATLSDSELSLNAVGQLCMDLQSAKDMHTRLTNGLIDGISIGYEVTKEAYLGGVRQLQEITLWEISLVTFPANTFARVIDVKHAHAAADIAAGFAADLKAGRVLSNANREKIKNAHGAMTDASTLLQELLDLTDVNLDDAKAMSMLLKVKRARLRVKAAQDIADAAAIVDGLVDSLDIAFDQLLIALGLPDAPDPDDGDETASKALLKTLADMRSVAASR